MGKTIVSFRPYGRAGNFLFMASQAIAFALRNGVEFSMPYTTTDRYWNPIYLQHLVHPDYVQGREDVLINENGFEYKPIEFKEEWEGKQVIFNGYYQSEKYFADFRKEILYLFGFNWELKEDTVSVHVRRGDYVHLSMKHPIVTPEWYEQAMSMFPGKKFKFFSDDIKYCREAFGHRSDCEFSTNTNEIDDLVEASCCNGHVSSSSTFSWWINWLDRNPDKKIYIPKLWFVEGWMNMDTSDVIPEGWIKL